MARQGSGRSKKVTAENLAGLGVERLAEILAEVAQTRADLKRRLRMELAAQQGPGPLTGEIDKRLAAFETSRGKVSWRQRPAFIRDLDATRDLIAARLSPLDVAAAVERLWRFMETAHASGRRYREQNGELGRVYERAAGDLGGLLKDIPPGPAAATLVDSLARNLLGWKAWLPALLAQAPRPMAKDALRFMAEQPVAAVPGRVTLVRQLADAAGDIEAFRATYTADALATAPVAAGLARRYLDAGRIGEAGAALQAAAPKAGWRGKPPAIDFDWESLWIEYLERSGRADEAQAVRWASFERTLSAERARAFVSRLDGFDDVEAEAKAFALAAADADFQRGLQFLMEWPALAEASRMIERRRGEVRIDPEQAELWAGKLRRRFPKAAYALLRDGAATAFKRRDFTTCNRLSAEAEALNG